MWNTRRLAGIFRRYGIALLAVAAAVIIRRAIVPIFGYQTPYFIAYPTIMVISVVVGTGPGVAASILGICATEMLLVDPIGRLHMGWADIVRLGILFCPVVYLGYVGRRLRAARAQAQAEARAAREADKTLRDARNEAERRAAEMTAVFDALAQPVVVFDTSGKPIKANPAAMAAYGLDPTKLDTDGYTKLAERFAARRADGHPVRAEEFPSRRALRGETIVGEEHIFTNAAGRQVAYEVSAIPLTTGGRIVGAVGVWYDVMGRDEAEAALRNSEERYRRIVETANEGIWTVDADAIVTYANPRLAEMLDYAPDEIAGRSALDFVPEEDRARVWEDLTRRGQSARGMQGEFRFRRADGSELWCLVNSSPIQVRDENGLHVNTLGMLTDITERKRAEEALRESEERFRVAQELSLDAFTILGAVRDETGAIVDFRWTYVNPEAGRILRYRPGELVGQRLLEVLPGNKTNSDLFERYVRVVETGEAHDYELRYESEGIQGWFRNMTVKLGDGVAVYFADITERKKREEELHQLNRTLRALSRSSRSMMRATDEPQYLQEVCRIVVEDCGHAMVWIGYAEDDEYKSVRPVAWSGFEEGYLETLKITWADTERGRGPTGTAIRTGKVSMCTNLLTDPAFEPWRDEAIKRGYASSIVLPLMTDGRAFGAITIYSREPDPFSAEETAMLTGLADDLSYGITAIRLRAAHARADEARRRSEERYRGLVELSPDAVFINRNNRIEFANPAALELFGATAAEQIVGRSPFEMFHPEYHPIMRERIGQLLAGDRVPLTEGRIVRLDGTVRDAEVTAAPFDDQDGRAIQVILRDITERKQAQEALRQTRDYLENLFNYANAPIIVWDPEFRITRFNHAFERLTGRSAADVVGQKLEVLFPDSRREQAMSHIHRAAAGERWEVVEIPIAHAGGAVRTVLWNSATLYSADGSTPIATIAQGQDITERKLAEEALQETADELARSNRDLDMFASAASHDLQEPLRMVTEYLGLLQQRYKDKLDKDANDFIHFAVDGATRMSQLVRDLLAYARVGTRGKALESTDCGQVLQYAMRNLKVAIEENGAVITHDPLPTVQGDATQLTQLFQNLIGNAIKFHGPDAPRVHVAARQTGQDWQFSVSDNGIGIEPRQFDRIFRIFQRLHTHEQYSGTGVGLAICKRIVERHGGRIWVESEPGKGSTFCFTLSA
jgi:PAS domain S-box-containing protein